MIESRRDIVINNSLAEMETLANALEEFCRENSIDEESYFDLRLALDEAVSNIIKYAYDDGHVHQIHVRAGIEATGVVLEITDDGRAFNPLSVPDPDFTLPLEKQPIGGRGIYLIRNVMDRVEYHRVGARNILRLTKTGTQ